MIEAAARHECRGPVLCRRCGAAYLGVSVDTIDDVVRADGLPEVRVGGRVRLRRVDLDAWIVSHTVYPWQAHTSTAARERKRGGVATPLPGGASANRQVAEIEARLLRPRRARTTRRTSARMYQFPVGPKTPRSQP